MEEQDCHSGTSEVQPEIKIVKDLQVAESHGAPKTGDSTQAASTVKYDIDSEEEDKMHESSSFLSISDISNKSKMKSTPRPGGEGEFVIPSLKLKKPLDSESSYDPRGESDVRIAMIGNAGTGKSTLVGVLTQGELDDGQGSARWPVFNYTHETDSGRGYTISQEIMGFDTENKWVQPGEDIDSVNQLWGYIVQNSQKLVTLIDLGGDKKYLKTIHFAIEGLLPDYCGIVIDASQGLKRTAGDQLVIALVFKIPIFIVMTKVDIATKEQFESTKKKLKLLVTTKSINKIPLLVKEADPHIKKYAENIFEGGFCPIFTVSNVTGQGIEEVKEFLGLLKSRIYKTGHFKAPDKPVEFLIDGIYLVRAKNLVIGGVLRSGKVKIGDTLQIGPDPEGSFEPVVVQTIHYKRTLVDDVVSGQTGCFKVSFVNTKEQINKSAFRKGMVL